MASEVSESHPVHPRLAEFVAAGFGPDVRVARQEPMAGDASTRRYVRVWLEGGGAPRTVVAMVMQDREAAKTSDEAGEVGETDEIPYVNVHHLLVRCGVDVPQIYVDVSDLGILLLEDIGETPLWDAVRSAPAQEVRRLFGQAIEQLVRLQVDSITHNDGSCVGFRRNFDRDLYQWEFEHFIEWGFSGCAAGAPGAGELVELRRQFARISHYLGDQPRVLNHRDFHAWNLFVQDGRIRVIDFQDALLAAAPYDLATLLGDRVTPQAVPTPLERQLVDDYADAWSQHSAAPWRWNRDELWQVYSSCAVQKAFKVVGRFHFLDRVKGKPAYLGFLPPTLERIRGLLAARPDLASVSEILQGYFPELRS